MSEDPQNYSDPSDKVDYQVIKSYGRANKSYTANKFSVFAICAIVIISIMTVFQASKIRDLEKKVTNLEEKVTNLEKKVTNLEEKVTNLEKKVTNLEKK